MATRWSDGYVGAGNAKARLGRGVIILLVVSADGLIRRLAVMEGRSVFAKFKIITAFDGLPLAALRSAPTLASTAGRTLALTRAIEQGRQGALQTNAGGNGRRRRLTRTAPGEERE